MNGILGTTVECYRSRLVASRTIFPHHLLLLSLPGQGQGQHALLALMSTTMMPADQACSRAAGCSSPTNSPLTTRCVTLPRWPTGGEQAQARVVQYKEDALAYPGASRLSAMVAPSASKGSIKKRTLRAVTMCAMTTPAMGLMGMT